jgi:hypothetical protein
MEFIVLWGNPSSVCQVVLRKLDAPAAGADALNSAARATVSCQLQWAMPLATVSKPALE